MVHIAQRRARLVHHHHTVQYCSTPLMTRCVSVAIDTVRPVGSIRPIHTVGTMCPIDTIRPIHQHGSLIPARRHIDRRVRGEEVRRDDRELNNLHRPDRTQVSNHVAPQMNGTTHITGQSSTLGLCVKPNTLHTTTSSCTVLSFRATASATPPFSFRLCNV
jgi:hypothetical protein